MITINEGPAIASELACLNLDSNGHGVACIKMSHDSEGMHVLNVALDTCCEASVMNLDLFNKSFRDTGAVVSYTSTSLRNKALQAAEGSKVTALAFVWIQRRLTSKIRLQFPVVVCKDLNAGILVSLQQQQKWGLVLDLPKMQATFSTIS